MILVYISNITKMVCAVNVYHYERGFKLYNQKIENNNIIYSIDKIRFKTLMSFTTFSELEFRFDTVWKDYIKQKYTSARMKNFFYNYDIEIEDGKSFWFGFLHNTEKREERNEFYNFTIEFNPNKIKDNKILMYILGLSGSWYIKSYDLAMDLKININELNVDFSGRKEKKIISRGYDDKTIYLGKGDGRIKVYNKKKESNINNIKNLTRVEISRELTDFDILGLIGKKLKVCYKVVIKYYLIKKVLTRFFLKQYFIIL